MSDPRISNVCGCGRVLGSPLDKDGKCIYCQSRGTELLLYGIGRASHARARVAKPRPLELSHPFILDCEESSECAACGKYGHAKIHRKPHEMTRQETEATCEPAKQT